MENRTPPRRWSLPLLLGLVVFACFCPALANDFVNWDDDANFLENPNYRGLSPAHLRWMFTTYHMGNYQPLTWLTLGLDYELWGMNAGGYHFTSLALHVASTILFYFFLLALLDRIGSQTARWPAAIGALFFGIHPLRVESVVWATERKDVLCGFFLMISLIAYLRMEGELRQGRSGRRWLVISVATFACSLFSKVLGIMLPVVLLALDVYPLGRFVPGQRRMILLEKVPYLVASAIAGVVTLYAIQSEGLARSIQSVTLGGRIKDASYGLCFYLGKTALPLSLSPFYPAISESDPRSAALWRSAVMAAGLAAVAGFFHRRFPALLAALFCYAALLLPVLRLNYDSPHIVADRYSYLSCLPWAVLAVFLLARSGNKPWVRPAAAAVLLAFGALTFLQTRVWKDSITLWSRALEVDATNVFAYNNRGTARAARNDRAGAIEDFTQAIRLDPGFSDAFYNRGSLKKDAGDLDGAIGDHTEAIRLTPGFARAWRGRGLARQAKGDTEGAGRDLAEAARLGATAPAVERKFTDSAEAKSVTDDGISRASKGDLDGAIAQFTRAIQLDPKVAGIHYNRGYARASKGDQSGAIADYTEALKLDAGFADAYADRGMARALLGDLNGAVEDYSQALKIRPRDPVVFANRGVARAKLGDRPGAADDFQNALALAPPDWPRRQTVQALLARVKGR